MNWNDLRYVLAVARGKTLASAARMLGVDDTTVARRLAAIEAAVGVRLCQRGADGTLRLTPSGERAALHAERVEREVGRLDGALRGTADGAAGSVRLTAVPIIVNHLLLPAAKNLLNEHPALQLELVADARDLSLTRREADVALRLARPKTGGTRVMARRVGMLRYAVYGPAGCPAREAKALPWVTYEEAMAHLPQARWIAAAGAGRNETIAGVRVNDAEGVLAAVAAGLGRSLLPGFVGDGDARLKRLGADRRARPPTRELWLLTHADLRALGRIEAVVAWIEQIVPR